jgi:hypothetical protein
MRNRPRTVAWQVLALPTGRVVQEAVRAPSAPRTSRAVLAVLPRKGPAAVVVRVRRAMVLRLPVPRTARVERPTVVRAATGYLRLGRRRLVCSRAAVAAVLIPGQAVPVVTVRSG